MRRPRPTSKKPPLPWWKRGLRSVGLAFAIVLAGYLYQPQKFHLFRPAPVELPRVDPDSTALLSPTARVAVVVAHPDDAEFYIGSTLHRLGQKGATIRVFCLTDGDKSFYPPGLTDVAENRRVRRDEQRRASAMYGADVRFFGWPDGRLYARDDVISGLRQELDAFRPTHVMAFDDHYIRRRQHSDHVEAGRVVAALADDFGPRTWLMRFSTTSPNWGLDLGRDFNAKRELLAVHASQFREKREFIEAMVYELDEGAGARLGFDLSEGFRCDQPGSD